MAMGPVSESSGSMAPSPQRFMDSLDPSRPLLRPSTTNIVLPSAARQKSIFLVWAYVPETWLNAIGIHYYPSRYWALALPTYMTVTAFLALIFYIGLNFLSTPPTSLNTLFDEFSRKPSSFDPGSDEYEIPIEPISDIGIDKINRQIFGELS